MTSTKKRSPFWKYFVVCEDNGRYAECLLCNLKISRGGEGKSAGTSALKNHMKTKHKDKFAELESNVDTGSSNFNVKNLSILSPKVQQKLLTLTEAVERKIIWDINDAKSKEYHYLIAEMIALDNQPLSVIENVGFSRLMKKAVPCYEIPSRTYIIDKIIPDIYERIHNKISKNILEASAISISADMWTCSANNTSFLCFTAHWLSAELKMEHAVLAIKPFLGSHTGENIAIELRTILTHWNIEQSKIHTIVHESGTNIVKVADFKSVRCFINSIQLVISDALNSQPEVLQMIAAVRRIVTHFNHSSLATEKLKNIQKDLNLPEHQLIQDVNTRWNSTFYMQERLIEQKEAVSIYLTNPENTIENLSSEHWTLMEQCIVLLKPFEEITKIVSSNCSCISEVLPLVATLIRYLDKEETGQNTNKLLKMKETLKVGLEKHFEHKDNKLFLIATALDPRFKLNFMDQIQIERTRQIILLEALKMSSDDFSDSNSDSGSSSPKKSKKSIEHNVGSELHNTFWDCFNEIAEENTDANVNVLELNAITNELEYYLNSPRIPRNSDPYAWWFSNFSRCPILSRIAKIYLSAPCSSVYSERMFSEAGALYEKKRNRLLTLNAEKNVFIHYNLPLLNFNY